MVAKINKAARAVLERLRAINYEQPHWNESEVIRCFERQYDLLCVDMPEIEIADDLVIGYQLAWGNTRSAAEFPAWGTSRPDPWTTVLLTAWRGAEAADRDAIRSVVWDEAWSDVWSIAGDIHCGVVWYADALRRGFTDIKPYSWRRNWLQIAAEQLQAFENGLGWFFPMRDKLILVPLPRMILRNGLLHFDGGKAVTWRKGTGFYYLHDINFDEALYKKITSFTIEAEEVLRIPNAERRAAAMAMLRPNRLLAQLNAELIHTGVKGTKLYRVNKFMGTSRTEYCMVMDDVSTDRQFLEWVEPKVGRQGNADLCQAKSFGITLEDYLSMEQES